MSFSIEGKNIFNYNSLHKLQNLNDLIKFQDNKVEELYKQKKDLYWNFLTSYFSNFPDSELDYEISEKVKFIKNFFNENNLNLEEQIFKYLKHIFSKNLNEIQVVIDWDNKIIKEIEYVNLEKFLMITFEFISSDLALLDLYLNKYISLQEYENHMKLLGKFKKDEEKKIIRTNKSMEFKDLKPNNFNRNFRLSENNKNINHYFNSFFYGIINEFDFSEIEIENYKKQIWILMEFFYNMYINYYEYLNLNEIIFNNEIEILEKIIILKNTNDFLKDVNEFYIYFALRKILFKYKIKKIDNELSYYLIEDFNKSFKYKILDLNEFFFISIVGSSFCLMDKIYNIKNELEEEIRETVEKIFIYTHKLLIGKFLDIQHINI